MANWKKVVVSGSSPEFSTLHVDNLSSGVVIGSGTTLSTQAINGSGDILATTGSTGVSASGSFSGSFFGLADNATTASYANFAASGNGSFSGSFSGSFQGDGSELTGIATVLNYSGSTGNGNVDLKTQTFSIVGTANEIVTSGAGQTLTIGLPDNVTVNGDLTVQQNLTVFGTASFQQTTNLEVADRFVLFASGSNTPGDGGIVVQQATQNVGELFGYDSTTVRWGVTSSFSADGGTFTPDGFMAVASIGVGADPTAIDSRYQAKGNIFIGTDEGIWIYS
jgi:hypothetical protein